MALKHLDNTVNPNSKDVNNQMPVRGGSFNKISCLWRQNIRTEKNVERQFLRNQKKVEQERAQDEYETQISREM